MKLTRNLFGTEPLYYIRKDGKIITDVSIKPLIEQIDKIEVDKKALNHYLAFRCTPEDRSMVKGIYKVPPGHMITEDEIKPYWKREYKEEHKGEDLYKHIENAIKINLEKHQGLFLSGGMDSSSILAIAEKLGHKLKTFSVGFNINGHDELKEAKQTAEYFKTEHSTFKLNKTCLKRWPELVYNFEEPMADPTKIPVYYLCRRAQEKKCSSILVGEGGDENFASYSQYKFMKLHKYMKLCPPYIVRKIPQPILNRFFRYTSELGQKGIERFALFAKSKEKGVQYQNIVSIFNNIERYQLLGEDRFMPFNPDIKDLNSMVDTDIKAIMSEDLGMKMYKNASKFGVKGNFPFLERDLFEYTSSMNQSLKGNKDIFKKSMKGVLPDFIMKRKKSRFFVPIHKWGIRRIANKILTKEQVKDYFDYDYIRMMIDDFDKSPLFYARQMFALIDFIIWKRIFIDGEHHKKVRI